VHLRTERVPTAVEDAVIYIIFLVDADTLFDVALGMYDFSLVLLVAQHAQKVGLCDYPNFYEIQYADIISGSSRVPSFLTRTPRLGKVLSAIPDR
jgi:elongator complex protein 1